MPRGMHASARTRPTGQAVSPSVGYADTSPAGPLEADLGRRAAYLKRAVVIPATPRGPPARR